MPTESHTSLQLLEKTLSTLAKLPWMPSELLHLVGETSRLQEQARQTLRLPDLPAPTDPEAHRQGLPLLAAHAFPYDTTSAVALWDALMHLLATQDDGMQESAVLLKDALQCGTLAREQAFAAFLHDDADFFAHWRQQCPQAPALPHFLAQAALTPSLQTVSALLAPQHDTATVWEYGHCPHCGRHPFMGQLRRKEGERWHTCSFCRLTYRVARLQCPFCLERDVHKLRFFSSEQEPGYQVHVCDTCKNYIKISDLREKGDLAVLPELDDLASLALDILARQHAFTRPTPSAWGF